MPTLGKREREPSPEPSPTSHGGDTSPVKPDDSESAHEFFAHFLSSDKTVSSYPDFLSIATNLFEPGKFIGRAAAKEYHEKQDRYDFVKFVDVIVTLSSLRNAIVLSMSLLFRL